MNGCVLIAKSLFAGHCIAAVFLQNITARGNPQHVRLPYSLDQAMQLLPNQSKGIQLDAR